MYIVINRFSLYLQCRNENIGSSTSLVNEIKSLQKNIDNDSTLHIEVRRNFVLSDALREARKNKFNPKKFIKVIKNCM